MGPHCASSKSALHGFLHWLARNVAKKGITVNAMAPVLISGIAIMPGSDDDGIRVVLRPVSVVIPLPAECRKRVRGWIADTVFSFLSRIPIGRLGTTEKIAETVLWLTKVAYVTKNVITVDGGIYPRRNLPCIGPDLAPALLLEIQHQFRVLVCRACQ